MINIHVTSIVITDGMKNELFCEAWRDICRVPKKPNLLATNVIAEQGSGVKTYRWARSGIVMMASHGVVTQSTIYVSGSLEWSPEHMNLTVPTCTCESRERRFRHSMGMMGGQSSVTLHSVCELKYAGAQGMSYSSFMGMPQL